MSMHPLKRMIVCIVAWSVLLPAVSFSQEASPSSAAEKRQQNDASVDRNILMSSAETIGKGKVAFNSYELVIAGLTYGITDNLQVSLSSLLPIVEDIPLVMLASAKLRLVQTDRFVFSLASGASIVHKDEVTAGTVGLIALCDLILDSGGVAVFSFGGNIIWAFGGAGDEDVEFLDGGLFALHTGFNFRIHKNIKLLSEFILAGGHYKGDFQLIEEGLMLGYGVRFFGSGLAVDLTFIRPIHPDTDTPFVMGLPLVAFSARF